MVATETPTRPTGPNTAELRLIKSLTVAFEECEAAPYLESFTPPARANSYLRIVYRDPKTHKPISVRYLGSYDDVNRVVSVDKLKEVMAEYREALRESGPSEARKILAEFLDEEFDLKIRTGGKWVKAVREAVKRLASPAPGPYTIAAETEYRRKLEEAIIELRRKAKEALSSNSTPNSGSPDSHGSGDSEDDLWEVIDVKEYTLDEEERERYLEKIRREVEEIEGAEEPEEPEPAEDVEEVVMEAIQEVVDEDLLAQAGAQSSPDSPKTTEPTEAKTGTKDESKETKEKDDKTEDAGETRVTARGIVYRVINTINERDDIEGLDDLLKKSGVPSEYRDAVSHVLDHLAREGLILLGHRLTKVSDRVFLPKEQYERLVKEIADKFGIPEGTPAREKGGQDREDRGESSGGKGDSIDLSWIGKVPKAADHERRAVYRIIDRFKECGDEIDPSKVAFELDMASGLVWTLVEALERSGFIEKVGETKGGTEVYRWVGPEKVPYRLVDWTVYEFKRRHEELF